MVEYPFVSYHRDFVSSDEMATRAKRFYLNMDSRRSVRDFSDKAVSKNVIEFLLKTAGTAPSGAHKQPWTFAAVSNPAMKKIIREQAEKEERLNYSERMSEEWLRDLAPLGTDEHKPFLEIAPWLIVVFKKTYDIVGEEKRKNYYVNESVGLAAGFLLSAIHDAGLVALTHTPSPMDFLGKLLKRPKNERAHLLIPVGYPDESARVPDIQRKKLDDIAVWIE